MAALSHLAKEVTVVIRALAVPCALCFSPVREPVCKLIPSRAMHSREDFVSYQTALGTLTTGCHIPLNCKRKRNRTEQNRRKRKRNAQVIGNSGQFRLCGLKLVDLNCGSQALKAYFLNDYGVRSIFSRVALKNEQSVLVC